MDELNSKLDKFFVSSNGGGFSFIRVDTLAEYLGTAEAGLRFLLGLVVGFPLAAKYILISNSSANIKHLYFTICGLLINYFVFGADSVYVLFSIIISYASFVVLGASKSNVIFSIIFHTGYLLGGYIKNASSDGYDIKWTTPQCILCMRMIGLAWDVYDGNQDEKTLSADQRNHCVKKIPSFMEIFGYSYCFCGLLSGPQFSFRRYNFFVNNKLINKKVKNMNSRYWESLKRFAAAFLMMVFNQLTSAHYKPELLFQKTYLEKSLFLRITDMALIYYVQFTKYVIVWWLAESICMLIGLSYHRIDAEGNASWDGLRNFKFRQFVFGGFFQDIIESFNINTNLWSGRYLFRRLRFLGNKSASHVVTLLYLALWHGFYVGYFIMFALEFIIVICERQMCDVMKKLYGNSFEKLPRLLKMLVQVAGALIKFYACGFFATSFILLRWRRIKIVYANVYYWPVVLMCVWLLLLHPVLTYFAKKKTATKPKDE